MPSPWPLRKTSQQSSTLWIWPVQRGSRRLELREKPCKKVFKSIRVSWLLETSLRPSQTRRKFQRASRSSRTVTLSWLVSYRIVLVAIPAQLWSPACLQLNQIMRRLSVLLSMHHVLEISKISLSLIEMQILSWLMDWETRSRLCRPR